MRLWGPRTRDITGVNDMTLVRHACEWALDKHWKCSIWNAGIDHSGVYHPGVRHEFWLGKTP